MTLGIIGSDTFVDKCLAFKEIDEFIDSLKGKPTEIIGIQHGFGFPFIGPNKWAREYAKSRRMRHHAYPGLELGDKSITDIRLELIKHSDAVVILWNSIGSDNMRVEIETVMDTCKVYSIVRTEDEYNTWDEE
jgi:hypothetical protein